MQEEVQFRFDLPCLVVSWIHMVMHCYILYSKFDAMLTLLPVRLLVIRGQGFVNLIKVECSKVDCLLHRVISVTELICQHVPKWHPNGTSISMAAL